MKKILLALSCIALSVAAMSAQSVKLYKNGEVVATYSSDEVDKVEFEAGATETTPAEAVSKVYSTKREVTLPAMASMGVLVSDTPEVSVTATGDNTVDVVLPPCDYTMGSSTFNLPAATVSCTVSETADGYSFSGKFEGTIDTKSTTVDLTATVSSDGAFTFTQDMKYGTMPMVLHMVYTNPE